MSKQQMIMSILESVIVDPVVLSELKQYRLHDEDNVQKFILAIKNALRQEVRRTFNDWGYADSLGMSMLFVSGLMLLIDSGFSIKTLNGVIQNAIRISAVFFTTSSVGLHHIRRKFVQGSIAMVSEVLLHFYTSPQMMLWRQCQAQ